MSMYTGMESKIISNRLIMQLYSRLKPKYLNYDVTILFWVIIVILLKHEYIPTIFYVKSTVLDKIFEHACWFFTSLSC